MPYQPPRDGHFYPRIAREPLLRPRTGDEQRAASATAAALRLILADLRSLLAVVELDNRNLKVFGHVIRRQLLLACMEVESGFSAVLRANRYADGRWSTKDYVKLRDVLLLSDYRVGIHDFSDRAPLQPFTGWDEAQPTASLPWYDAYNRTKHDRELNLSLATLDALLNAVAGAYVVACAQFGSWVFGPQSEIGQTYLWLAFEPVGSAYVHPSSVRMSDWTVQYYPF